MCETVYTHEGREFGKKRKSLLFFSAYEKGRVAKVDLQSFGPIPFRFQQVGLLLQSDCVSGYRAVRR